MKKDFYPKILETVHKTKLSLFVVKKVDSFIVVVFDREGKSSRVLFRDGYFEASTYSDGGFNLKEIAQILDMLSFAPLKIGETTSSRRNKAVNRRVANGLVQYSQSAGLYVAYQSVILTSRGPWAIVRSGGKMVCTPKIKENKNLVEGLLRFMFSPWSESK